MTYIATAATSLKNSPYILYDIGQNILEGTGSPIQYPIYISSKGPRTIFSKDGVSHRTVNVVNRIMVWFDLNPETEDIELGLLDLDGDFLFEGDQYTSGETVGIASMDELPQPTLDTGNLDMMKIIYYTEFPGWITGSPLSPPVLTNILFKKLGRSSAINQRDLVSAFDDRDTARKTLYSALDKSLLTINDGITGTTINGTILGTKKNDRLKAGKASVHLKGMGGKDKLIGSKEDDILDGGEGNDVLIGKKGADKYIFSPGKDVIRGFKISDGDYIVVPKGNGSYIVDQQNKNALIMMRSEHKGEWDVTKVLNISQSELLDVIEIA